ncbi:hypothetical protein T484DRAFT_1837095 [Baffinella frigidus]|nr:hypothetical protein T484DRAFT_1837095 [Cryptophyta sp. CCMP2293]
MQTVMVIARPFIARDPAQGCLTQVFAAVDAQLEGQGGLFLDNMEEIPPPPAALDADTAAWLWSTSLKIVGLPEEAESALPTWTLGV